MQRNIQKNGAINLALLFLIAVAAFAVARSSNVLAGQIAAVFVVLGALAAIVSWFQMRLEERERLERLEFDELARGGASSGALFEATDAEAFPARRSREQFEKFFVPGFTVVLMLAQAAAAWWCWNWLGKMPAVPRLSQPLAAMGILGMLGLVAFLIGKYSSGLARMEKLRLLNPSSSQMLMGAYLLWLVVAGIGAHEAGFASVDFILARTLAALLAVLALENLLTMLLELYRPRVKGRVGHLLYDSRLVGLISHPEDVFSTAAHALDYQFGFKVSETWFYQFLRRAFAWLLLAQFGVLVLSTCYVFIETGEEALLERWGRPVNGREVLAAGFHFKLPWPVDRTYRYRTQQIQSFSVGREADEDHDESSPAVLWTVSHVKDEFYLLVASRETNANLTIAPGEDAAKKAPPVNLLAIGIPVQYQIRDLKAWAYNHADADALLRKLSMREVVHYLVGVDVNETMSTRRFEATEELRKRIQAKADELALGVKILFVGLQDVHPPVQVGAAYEMAIGAKQQRESEILRAEAYATRTKALAAADAYKRGLGAEAGRNRRVVGAMATESLFTNQLAAFRASPEVYSQRSYLQTLARHGSGVRKFILATTNNTEVLQLNMEDKIRDDILNVPIPTVPRK
jgi:modulator of FtsH protease HflK